ncbi:MAG: hypothetical protein GY853_05985 [PVC group bacterium]|nr:hypothetical protein [PVC group bacterium]
MNKGERNELLIKIKLLHMRDVQRSLSGPFRSVTNVGFDRTEYPHLPSNFNLATLTTLQDDRLAHLCQSLGISKSPTHSKSDVSINNAGYSVKSFASAPPALVNHTTRSGFEFACKHSNTNIVDLDRLVAQYWDLRQAGTIGEDIKNNAPNSPFSAHKSILAPVLQYFLFQGTGSRLSNHPANYILDYTNPLDPATWTVLNRSSVIDCVWDRLIFSVRAKKGMPDNYPNNANQSNNASIAIWTRYSSSEYRGALHIRASK